MRFIFICSRMRPCYLKMALGDILEKIQFADETMVVSGDNDAICGAVFVQK